MDTAAILMNETMRWVLLIEMILLVGLAFFFHQIASRHLKECHHQKLLNQEQIHQTITHQIQNEKVALKNQLAQINKEYERSQIALSHYQTNYATALEKLRYLDVLKKEKYDLTINLQQINKEKTALTARLCEQEVRMKARQEAANDKINLLENAEEHLRIQFEGLAQRVFEHKTRSVDEQSKQSIEKVLSPLRTQLEGFRKQVNDSFGEQAKERHTLIHEIKNLQKLNQDMAREAVNLTQALKNDNKLQGCWGEMILGRVLEDSGLREGYEYQVQVKTANAEGKYYQPDVIVCLPQNKSVVIDAKMTLTAYERYYNCDFSEQKAQALSEHIAAIRGHIRNLGEKDYHQLHNIESLDYVLMFIPIEPAFQLAIEAEPALIRDALTHNIILVSPTTLLVALRTISNLWRYEQQNQNAKIIADKAARLYDKIRLFAEDMEIIGSSLAKTTDVYHSAFSKLTQGKGNILRQTENFRALGIEIKKEINPNLFKQDLNDGA